MASETEPISAPNISTSKNDGPPTAAVQSGLLASDQLPSAETCHQVENYTVLDREGNTVPFKNLYSGTNSTRRVLVIFIRHFFCGSCQEYVRTLSASIRPGDLLRLPESTSITIIGCGDPGLIDVYAGETGCLFPIYADPTHKLYDGLAMVRTLALGSSPDYIRKSMLRIVGESIWQGLGQITSGLAWKGGDSSQNGGEFLFVSSGEGKEKQMTWCHRMKTTRDHTEIADLARILDPDGQVLLART
ncbi:hypothetical protein BBP40_001718 [Aspergillus hancockii]|nr:hypothetical protein BBP40_001718 [Aspergillus hancockii]